jgi:lysyl-tRNA synthetase class 2
MSHVPSDQELVRREALTKLRALGIEPFPADTFPVSHSAKQVKEGFKEVGHAPEGEQPPPNIVLAGRLMSVRVMGKASFAVLRDSTGDQQIYVNRDEICTRRGQDGVQRGLQEAAGPRRPHRRESGFAFRTKTGELTLHVKELTVLAKSLAPPAGGEDR